MRRQGHLAASLSATAAGFGAGPAMVFVVFTTLSRAGLADVRAQLAHVGRMRTVRRHKRNGHLTDFGAVAVEPDTLNHVVYVFFA